MSKVMQTQVLPSLDRLHDLLASQYSISSTKFDEATIGNQLRAVKQELGYIRIWINWTLSHMNE